MFKSSRRKAVKAKEKVTFKLEFHASRVPQRGWDKLLVSLVSLDTGKVKAKTGKVPVKNGTCQWTEPLFESTYISEESNGKDANKELYKLVVSMGLSRFGILGEITIKLVDYLQTAVPISLPLPLQNCNFGSILHVKIQRIMPKSASGELEDQKEVTLDQDLKLPTSDGGQQTESDSVLLAGDSVADSGQGNPPTENKVDACPMSTSSHSFDSVDVPSTPGVSESHLYGRDGLGDEELMSLSSSASSSGRHEAVSGFYDNNQESMSEFTSTEMLPKPSTSVDSYSSSPYYSKSSPGGNNKQNEEWNKLEWGLPDNSSSLFHGTESYDDTNSQRQTCLQRTGSVATATSWKPDGNQMAVAEIEALKQQLADETRTSEEVHKKLSLLIAERDSIKQEMENLKSLEKSPSSKAREGGLKWQQQVEEDASRRNVEELQDELDYATSMNSNLSFQLRKTQESNSELLLEIQDLEKLLQEKQLDIQASENKPESGGRRIEDTDKDLIKLVDTLQKQLEELERDSQELTEENLVLTSQLKQANDNLKDKDDIIAQLDIKSTCISNADSIAELEADKLGDDLKEKLRASEEARVLLERQSQGLQEKATRAEHDYRNALEIIKELEAANRKLEKEKGEAIITLEKQLKEAEKQVLVAVRNYDDVLQVMGGMKAETIELDREMSILLEAKEEVDASRSQLQNINAMLEDQLHQEQLKTSKVFQQSQENDSQFHQALNAAQAQTKSMEQIITELQSVRKELESEVKDLQEENKLSRSRIKELELHGAALEDETHSLKAARSVLEAEMQDLKSLKERFKSQEEAMIRWKQSKAGMEEKISHLQEANVKGSRRPLEEINSEFNELLQKQTSDLTRKLSEKEMEQKELKTRVFYLEEELQRKVNALSFAEKKLKEQREPFANDGSSQVSYFTRSLSRANSRIGSKTTIPPSREAKELSDLRDKVKLLEGEVKRKAAELEVSKQQLKEQHTQLSIRIEHLELANEELVKEHSNSNLDQALKELNSLQNQNAILFQRENDLLVRLSSQEALQSEMEILKEEKKELERALLKFNAAAKGENVLKRISTLETELAEVLEANIMYKSQLQSAFAKQQNVHAAALENLGSVDQVIKDLAELKRKNLLLEDELCDMRERYFNMSLQFAEVEGEREELVMTIRNLRGTKKLMPYRSANF